MSDERGRDRVFARRLAEVRAFEFDTTVAEVFQDMISRSVPGYALLLRMIGLYAEIFVTPGSRVYDLGCSLGEASRVIAERIDGRGASIVAVDNSAAMIERCRAHPPAKVPIDWRCADIREIEFHDASLVVLNLTLQFLAPTEREPLLERIHAGMIPGTALLLAEKVCFDDAAEQQRMTQLYQGFKKTMGYSDLEIAQKRNALENVLIPDSMAQHEARLDRVGFTEIYCCFRAFNFASWLAVKA